MNHATQPFLLTLTATCITLAAPLGASAATLVGPSGAPFGIDDLEVTLSSGPTVFDVRFDERSFNDIYGAGTPDLTLTTDADVVDAMEAVRNALNGFGAPALEIGSTPT